jgi:hypothetical protein
MSRNTLIVAFALALCGSVAADAADSPRESMTAALKQACPAKHLEFIASGDFEGLLEGWETLISPAEHQRYFDSRSQLQPRCASVSTGLTCDNGVDAEAIEKAGLQQSFVKYACASELACTGPNECHGSAAP